MSWPFMWLSKPNNNNVRDSVKVLMDELRIANDEKEDLGRLLRDSFTYLPEGTELKQKVRTALRRMDWFV